jgi:hypothetical protein
VAEFQQSNVASTEDGGEELMLLAVDCDLVAQAFQRLSERHRRILNLREGSGWSYQRIADHEGVGITAVETLLWRARQALKREFAALAGSEGRIAGWAGGLFSLSMLRRLLHGPAQVARRMGHTGSAAAVAVGSAVAATAVVVTASVGSPPPAAPVPASSPAPVVAAAVTPGHPPIGGLLGASPRSAAAQRAASSAGTPNVVPLVPALPLSPPTTQPTVPGVSDAVNGLGSTGSSVGDVVNTLGGQPLGSVTPQAASPVGAATQNVPNLLAGTAGPAASATCDVAGNVISALGGVLCGVSRTSPTAG